MINYVQRLFTNRGKAITLDKNVYPDKEPNKAPGGRGWGVFEKEKLPVCSQGNRVSFLLRAAPWGGGEAGPGGGEAGPGGGVGTTFSLLHCVRTASESANVCCRSASFIRSSPGPDGLRIPVPMLPRDPLMDQDPKPSGGAELGSQPKASQWLN